ncbi:hypothetical protein [Coleofasciculus sp.]
MSISTLSIVSFNKNLANCTHGNYSLQSVDWQFSARAMTGLRHNVV